MRIITVVCLMFSLVAVNNVTAQSIVRGPYLQNPTSTSIKVMWRTDAAADSKVYYGTDPQNLTQSVEDVSAVTDHTVAITNLQPFTQYYYSVGTTSQVLSGPDDKHHFTTSVVPGASEHTVRVWAIGDFGKANTEEKEVMESFINYNNDTLVNVWIWLGDNVYDDGLDQEYQAKVFDTAYYGQVMTYMPFMPCPGNHDYGEISPPTSTENPNNHSGPYYDIVDVPTNGEAGGLASGTELYYSYDYGHVHFVSINSEIGSPLNPTHDWIGANPFSSFNGSPFTDWLEDDLAANIQPFVIAYFHQPPHTAGSHLSSDAWEVYMEAMRENIVPILEDYNVDIIINGHSHVYERSVLMHGFYGVPSDWNNSYVVDGSSGNAATGNAYVKDANTQGTVYIVQGNSASKTTDPPLNHPAMYFSHGCDDCVGSTFIEVKGNKLRSRYLTAEGQILDDFTIEKPHVNIGVGSEVSIFADVQVYPNPFDKSTTLTYNLKDKSKVTIELFDITGKSAGVVYNGSRNSGTHSIDIDGEKLNLAKGNYVLKLTSENGSFTEKILKLK